MAMCPNGTVSCTNAIILDKQGLEFIALGNYLFPEMLWG